MSSAKETKQGVEMNGVGVLVVSEGTLQGCQKLKEERSTAF